MEYLLSKYRKMGSLLSWLIFVIMVCGIITLILFLLQVKPNSLSFIKALLFSPYISLNDSWMPMIKALQQLKETPQQSPYDMFFKEGIKFQYPLTSLMVFDLPHRLLGLSYEQISYWLDRISFFCIFVFGFVSARLLILVLKHKRFENTLGSSSRMPLLVYILVFVLTFLFYPMIKSYSLGQIQTILTLLSAISLLCWQMNKKALAGLVIGLICLIKPQLALLFIWGIIRKQWSMVVSGGIVVGIGLLMAICLYGFRNNLDYLSVLSFLSKHGEVFHSNHSINGLINRLLHNGNSIEWGGFPPYHVITYTATLISSLLIIIIGLFWNYQKKNIDVIDLSVIILCATMASPIAWEHHYGILFTIFLVLSPFACYFYKDKKWNLMILAIGYVLVSQYFKFIDLFANTSLNILQSYLFFGACIVLYYLLKVSRKLANLKVEVD